MIYDATVSFCERFVDPRSRTVDQMVQAARSGRQNIAEGSRASAASSQTELRLVSVARASLDELLLDYEDFLRQRGHRQWAKDDPQARAVRAVGARQGKDGDRSDRADRSDQDRSDPPDRADQSSLAGLSLPYAPWLNSPDPAVVANALICLIHQANYLLDQQLRALERAFVEGGGYSEQLAAQRMAHRARSHPPDRKIPACPRCGQLMALRTARTGKNAGSQFWGCTAYPKCKGTAPL